MCPLKRERPWRSGDHVPKTLTRRANRKEKQMTDSSWSEWISLGRSSVKGMAVGLNADGRLEIFANTEDGTLLHDYQQSPGGRWSGWQTLSPPQTISDSLAV